MRPYRNLSLPAQSSSNDAVDAKAPQGGKRNAIDPPGSGASSRSREDMSQIVDRKRYVGGHCRRVGAGERRSQGRQSR